MSLKGQVSNADWSVTCDTEQTPEGIRCTVGVEHRNVEGGRFVHRFTHSRTFDTEREAVLAGLCEGMTWINLKVGKTISVASTSLTSSSGLRAQADQAR
ncbi:UDP-glucose 4-epimerase [Caballeronia sp. RCC_10]|uniref:UDP-glucose 4-epimerase n=1 Tax=Caballeronia sp. RCC_10 TaxID=3239227 RepID=UPI00352442A7